MSETKFATQEWINEKLSATPKLKVTRGQALVLVGPQGCGKTLLAREIASRAGSYRETTVEHLSEPFGLGFALRDCPTTLIVEGLPERWQEGWEIVCILLSHDEVHIIEKMRKPRLVRAPNLIFCIDNTDPLLSRLDARRFHVVDLTPQ